MKTPERCIDCGVIFDPMGLIFCEEDEQHCRCDDCQRDYENEVELNDEDE